MCPEQMKLKVKIIEGCGVLHKRCETVNSVPLYKAETIFNRKLNSKVEFCASGKGCSSFLSEFYDVVIAIGKN